MSNILFTNNLYFYYKYTIRLIVGIFFKYKYVIHETSRYESKNKCLEIIFKSFIKVRELKLTVIDNINIAYGCLHLYI